MGILVACDRPLAFPVCFFQKSWRRPWPFPEMRRVCCRARAGFPPLAPRAAKIISNSFRGETVRSLSSKDEIIIGHSVHYGAAAAASGESARLDVNGRVRWMPTPIINSNASERARGQEYQNWRAAEWLLN